MKYFNSLVLNLTFVTDAEQVSLNSIAFRDLDLVLLIENIYIYTKDQSGWHVLTQSVSRIWIVWF